MVFYKYCMQFKYIEYNDNLINIYKNINSLIQNTQKYNKLNIRS